MTKHHKISYLEIPSKDISKTKEFFQGVFGWTFLDYGPDYTTFTDENIGGGFYKSSEASLQDRGSVLVVFYSDDLEKTQEKIKSAGGSITKPIYDFPGGSRFHFTDTNGNEYSVWRTREEG